MKRSVITIIHNIARSKVKGKRAQYKVEMDKTQVQSTWPSA